MTTLIQCQSAKEYVNFQTYKIRWDKLKKDMNEICFNNYPDIKHIEFNEAELFLQRQIVFYTIDKKEYRFYVGIDINGENVNFMFCKYSDFEHYAVIDNLNELVDVMMQNIIYDK